MSIGGQESCQGLQMLLRALHLPSFVSQHEQIAIEAQKQGWSFGRYLHQLAEVELADRESRRIQRDLKRSALPKDKTVQTLQLSRLSTKVQRQVPSLCEGTFVKNADNVLVFGLPGRGKTHLVCAIGHELLKRGYKVLFTPRTSWCRGYLQQKNNCVWNKRSYDWIASTR